MPTLCTNLVWSDLVRLPGGALLRDRGPFPGEDR